MEGNKEIGCSPELELFPRLASAIRPFLRSLEWSTRPAVAGVPGVAGVRPPELGVLLEGVPGVRDLPGVPGVRLDDAEEPEPRVGEAACREESPARRSLQPFWSMSWKGRDLQEFWRGQFGM